MLKKGNVFIADTTLGPIEYLERNGGSNNNDDVIITIHGAMGGYDQSDILARTIGPADRRYISISRPGYLGTPLKGRESGEAQADLIAALMDILKIDKTVIFAISGGGYSALHFALRHHDRCRALVLCSTTGGKNTVSIPFAFNVMRILVRIPFLPDLMRKKVDENLEKSLKRSISHPDILAQTLKNEDVMSLYRELAVDGMRNMAERMPGTVNDIRITQNSEYPLKEIMVPTLVVHGTDDPLLPFNEHGRRLAEEIPNARLYTAERGEHVTIFTHRDEVRNAVSDFLADLT